jgi:arylformamidase
VGEPLAVNGVARRWVAAVAGLALVATAGAGGSSDAAQTPVTPSPEAEAYAQECGGAPRPTRTVQYAEVPGVDPNLLSLDVHLPDGACQPVPAVLWVHGGAWAGGDKATEGADTKAGWANSRGWALVSVNYRLTTVESGVTWPTHGQDVATAVAFTLDHADELGVDPEHVALVGHSAGGHIVSMLSVDPTLLGAVGHDRDEIDCLVSVDTEGYVLTGRTRPDSELPTAMVANAFGTDEATIAAASPLLVVEETGGPVPDALIITRGPPGRQQRAQSFANALDDAGAHVQVVVADGYDHAQVNLQLGAPGDTVETPAVTAFLGDCLA